MCTSSYDYVIFLDIDGVLNHKQFYEKKKELLYKSHIKLPFPFDSFDVNIIHNLNKFWKVHSDVKLVISSSWRWNSDLEKILKQVGLSKKIDNITPTIISNHRGEEIEMFVKKHKVKNYAIIDDIDDMLEHQKEHLVLCDDKVGLTIENIETVIDILNLKKENNDKNLFL